MFNYRLTFKTDFNNNLNMFNDTMRRMAERSCAVTTTKNELSEALKTAIEAKNPEQAKNLQHKIDMLEATWKVERKGYELLLFGGKKDGKTVGGFCDSISKPLYDAYCKYITSRDQATFYRAVNAFLCENTVEGNPRDAAVSRMTSELLMIIGGKLNGNSKLAKGGSYISTMNKKTFKKYLFGAILDIKKANFTLKSEADKEAKA